MKANQNMGNMSKLLKMGNSVKQIIQIIGTILFITHLTACLWYMQAKMTDFPDDCWVANKDMLYEEPDKLYLVSFYWAF